MQYFRTLLVMLLAGLLAENAMGADATRKSDYVGAFKFVVEIRGVTQAEFKPVTGVKPELEVIEFAGHNEATLAKRPQRDKVGSMSFRHSPAIFNNLLAWWQECLARECAKQTVDIHLFDESQSKMGTLTLHEAFPKEVVAEEGFEELTFEFDLGDYVLATSDPSKK